MHDQPTTKRCRMCLQTKPVDQFTAHRQKKDGLQSYCKPCMVIRLRPYVRAHYAANREECQEKARSYRFLHSDELAEKRSIRRRAELAAHPESVRLHGRVASAVRRAIEKGVLIRPDRCELCGKECKPDAAHHDYSLPLSVHWLCKSCHNQWDHDVPKREQYS